MADQTYIDAKNLREFMSKMDYFVHNSKPDLVRSEYSTLAVNGGFDADSDWTKGADWAIGSGVASHVSGTAGSLSQPAAVVLSLTYAVGWSVSNYVSGSARFYLGSAFGDLRSADGEYLEAMTYTGTASLLLSAGATFEADVDNVSLWEADPSDGLPWLRLTQGHVFDERSSIWRDDAPLYEGEYDVINRSGQVFIKPITPPGANTRFQLFTAPGKRP